MKNPWSQNCSRDPLRDQMATRDALVDHLPQADNTDDIFENIIPVAIGRTLMGMATAPALAAGAI
jgi:hypothetical protein